MNPKNALSSLGRIQRAFALLWLVVLLASLVSLVAGFKNEVSRVDADLLALLPKNERRPLMETVLKSVAGQGERQLALLVSGKDEATTRQAVQLARVTLSDLGLISQGQGAAEAFTEFYTAYRQGLLTEADRAWLAGATPDEAISRARNLAYSAFSGGPLAWKDDAYGFFSNWLQSLGELTPLRSIDGELMLEHEGRHWAALSYLLPKSAFDSDFQKILSAHLAEARQKVAALDGGSRFLAAGVVLHAAGASGQASREMSLIGFGSLLGAFMLIGVLFQSARALKLIVISLLAGSVTALSVVFYFFEHVHLMTLVFGVSLIGVGVDYAILVYAQHLGSTEDVWVRFRKLLPTLAMALIIPVLGYLALALTPFPGLRQMAVFAVSGIFGAWLSVVLFYPWLLPATLPLPRRAAPVARLLARWPRWRNSPLHWAITAGLAALVVGGILRLEANDDIRSLFNARQDLMAQQIEVSKILRLPSPAQMFLVTAPTAEEVLVREEALAHRLRRLMDSGKISGYQAVSRWLPSQASQREAHVLEERLNPGRAALAREMEMPDRWWEEGGTPQLLTPELWLASPVSAAGRLLWMGQVAGETPQFVTVVQLSGLSASDVSLLSTLASEAPAIDGVEWMNSTAEISGVMSRYRVWLSWALFVACCVVPLILFAFFGRRVWRVVIPVFLSGAITLAVLGWLGINLNILGVLALMLTLGMGIDYAIFLQRRQGHDHTLLATSLAAATTLLSYGLLAVSSVPALHALGLTATLGVGLAWLLTPVFSGAHLHGPDELCFESDVSPGT